MNTATLEQIGWTTKVQYQNTNITNIRLVLVDEYIQFARHFELGAQRADGQRWKFIKEKK